jgi:hypothetical protein
LPKLQLSPHEKKQPMKPNQLKWGWRWQCLLVFKHHWLITQCQFDGMKAVGQRVKGHGSTFGRHEISHLSQWSQKYFAQHHVRPSSPHHAHNKKMDPHKKCKLQTKIGNYKTLNPNPTIRV